MKWKAIIAEDMEPARLDLLDLLDTYCPDIEIVGSTSNARDILPMIHQHKASVLFLDLTLGKDFAMNALPDSQLKGLSIIITTGETSVDKKVVRPETIAYLNKPIAPLELLQAIQKLPVTASQKTAPLQQLKIANSKGTHLLPLDQLIWLEAKGNRTHLHSVGVHKSISTSKTLKSFMFLEEEHPFCRIHHSYLINLTHVKNYHTNDGGWVNLSDGSRLSISRQRLPAFLARMELLSIGI